MEIGDPKAVYTLPFPHFNEEWNFQGVLSWSLTQSNVTKLKYQVKCYNLTSMAKNHIYSLITNIHSTDFLLILWQLLY